MLTALSRCRSVINSRKRCFLLQYANGWFAEDVATVRSYSRPFQDIPEIKGPLVSGTVKQGYDSQQGTRSINVFEIWEKRHEEFGNIYRKKVASGEDMVYCSSIADTQALFRIDGRCPNRVAIDGLTKMRDVMEMPQSILNLYGEEWYKMRQLLNELLLKTKSVWKYAKGAQEIALDLVEVIERSKDCNGEVPSFELLMNKWAFENSGLFLFNTRLGMLQSELTPVMEAVFEGMKMQMAYFVESMVSPETEMSEELTRNLITVRDEICRLAEESKNTSAKFDDSVLGGIMACDSINEDQKDALVMDMLIAAFETTARTGELALYALTLDPEVQNNLRNEVLSMKVIASGRDLDSMMYTRAFLKEVNRLYPFTHIMSRFFDHDVVLSGFRIPAGTNICNTINTTQSRNPDIFQNPNKFSPERWLDRKNGIAKFSSTGPFGFGARACPGRRLAMQEIHALLKAVLSRYRVEYNYGPMVSAFCLTGALSDKPRFAFHSL